MLTGQTFVLCSVPKPPKRRGARLGWNSSWKKKKIQNNSVLQSQFGAWADCSDHSFVDSAGTCRLMGLGSRLGWNTGTCRHRHQYWYYQSRHILYLAVCKKVILCICSAVRTANLLRPLPGITLHLKYTLQSRLWSSCWYILNRLPCKSESFIGIATVTTGFFFIFFWGEPTLDLNVGYIFKSVQC